MKNSKLKTQNYLLIITLLGFAFCILSFDFVSGCAQQAQNVDTTTTSTITSTTTITTTTQGPTPGYKIFNGQDASGQPFSFEYPNEWTVTEETLSSTWLSGQAIVLVGPGSWETSYPVISLWLVAQGSDYPSLAAYRTAIYSDRSVTSGGGSNPGLILETATTEVITNSSLTAEGWDITYYSISPSNHLYTEGTAEVEDHYPGELVTAESEWFVFQKGNYYYDFGFSATGSQLASREAFLHAKNTFRFN